ncbi:adenosylcobinamide-GDP ribazoletransferase [Paenibacillus sp. 1P07SE]|uniref:adenosylcobinamide-GDP ribazoletransferase n=1 Tax=Paenibacillus sp. 1P07SE TaxID=3132209 RepID=UPI0039A51212
MVDKRLTGWLSDAVIAMQFLTRLPLPLRPAFTPEAASRSLGWYPLAGLAVGALLALAAWGISSLVPPLPAAVLILAVWTALSGGLHLDGWMDTADGVLSHRSRERMLEIMRDSRVGAMGAIAGVLLLLYKFSLLAALLEVPHEPLPLWTLAAVPVWSRWWMAAAVIHWPKARADGGMAALFMTAGWRQLALASVMALSFSAVLLWIGGSYLWQALGMSLGGLAITALAGAIAAWWLTRKLGGLTGDTYGAMNEGLEAVLLTVVILII